MVVCGEVGLHVTIESKGVGTEGPVWELLGKCDPLVSLEPGGHWSPRSGVPCPLDLQELWMLLPGRPRPLQDVRLLFLQNVTCVDDDWFRAMAHGGCGPLLTSLNLSSECALPFATSTLA